MKEEAIKKINKMGRFAAIVSQIAKVFVATVFIVFTVATIALFFLPKQSISCSIYTDVAASIDISGFKNGTMEWSKERQQKLKDEFSNNKEFAKYDIAVNAHGLSIKGPLDTIGVTLSDIIQLFLWCTLELGMTWISIIFVHRLAKAFENCTSPFEGNVITKMQQLAFSLLPWCLLTQSADRALSHMLWRNTSPIAVNVSPIFMVLIIFMLTYIFKYGAKLQQESDETL